MARCGCNSDACTCVVQGAGLVTVTGTGTPNNPYVVQVTCQSVRTCFTAGDNIDITNGVISAEIDCDNVRGCFTPGDGIDINDGTISVCISTDANNAAVIGSDGCLYVPTVAGGGNVTVNDTQSVDLTITGDTITADVRTGCGLDVDATGVHVVTQAWPFACDLEANAGQVYCDAAGNIRTGPRQDSRVNGASDSNVTNVILNPGERVCIAATDAFDYSDICASRALAMVAGVRIVGNYSLNPQDGELVNFNVVFEESIDGAPFVQIGAGVAAAQTNAPDQGFADTIAAERNIAWTKDPHTYAVRMCVENEAGSTGNLTVNARRVEWRAITTERS